MVHAVIGNLLKIVTSTRSTTDYSHRTISMLLTLVEASVKVACHSTTTTDCRQRANYYMSLMSRCDLTRLHLDNFFFLIVHVYKH